MALQEGKLLAEATLSQTPAERFARERYATLVVGRSSTSPPARETRLC